MTTMNLPAQYTVIAAEEMVYLDGGTTIWEAMVDTANTAFSWINLVRSPMYVVYYLGSAGKNVDSGLTSASTVASLIQNVGYAIYYFGSSMSAWLKFPDLIAA